MRILLIKTSSLGDVIHALPAVTDAAHAIPGIRFDWVVEEGFAEIPAWHPAVDRVIPVALRRWRKAPFSAWFGGEWRQFRQALKAARYDAVIDAQGLLKSALLTRYVDAPVHGLDRDSAREPIASRFYTERHSVARDRHAVERMRALFSKALGYPLPEGVGEYGVSAQHSISHPLTLTLSPASGGEGTGSASPSAPGTQHLPPHPSPLAPHLVFLHGTTWETKHWPEAYWRELIERANAAGRPVRLPWGSETERQRAERLAAGLPNATVLPRLSLSGIAAELAGAAACVAVDTGLGHLAAALDVPTVSLYGPTDPRRTGTWGPRQIHLASDFPCAPCLQRHCAYRPTAEDMAAFDIERESPLCHTRLSPEQVWRTLETLLAGT